MSEKVSPISSEALKSQKRDAEERLSELRQQQVDAIEQGRELAHDNEIVVVKERIAAFDKAILRALKREADEEARRERAEARDEVMALKSEIETEQAAYLSLFEDAEKAAAEFARTIAAIEAKATDLYRGGVAVGNFLIRHGIVSSEPNEFSAMNLRSRLSGYISSVICIGEVSSGSVTPPDAHWSQSEERHIGGGATYRLRSLDKVLAGLQEPADETA
ncbi:MAG: hypothetical protein J0H80_04960 [Rhizobiales bacterium]|nr:hypothetical protein [Hyphomicrobiales bacterium]